MTSQTTSNTDNVGHQTRRGISWNLAGAAMTNLVRIVVIAVLGRALTSRDFGVVAAAVSVNVILYSIRDIGIGPALVQRKQLERGHLTTTFAVSLYLGVGLCALLLATAPLIGDLYNITASVDVIRALSVLFVLRGVATTSRIVCQRAMNFRVIAIVDTACFALGSAVSIVLAIFGAGPWALVAGYLVEEVFATVAYIIVSPPPFSLTVNGARFRELMTFGAGQTVSQVVGIVATYGDNFIVGSMLGERALGLYTRAYDLIKFPSAVFATIVGNVLFPAFSRLQDQRDRLAVSFRRVLFVNALVLLPASAVLIVLAPEAIRILVGSGWNDAVWPFRILAVSILFRTSQKAGAIVAQAAGRSNAIAIAYVVYMISVIGGAAIFIRWGIEGVAISTAISIFIVFCESNFIGARVSGLSLRVFVRAHAPGAGLALLVLGIAWPAAELLRTRGFSAGVIFPSVFLMAIVVCGLLVAISMRKKRGDFEWLFDELRRMRRRSR